MGKGWRPSGPTSSGPTSTDGSTAHGASSKTTTMTHARTSLSWRPTPRTGDATSTFGLRTAASGRCMSGDRGGQSRPIDVTEDEIRELAGPRDTPVGAVSRLHELVPSGPSGELSSESDTPVGVDLKDIDALRQTQDRP